MRSVIAAMCVVALGAGCAGPSASYKQEVNRHIAARDWAGAARIIEQSRAYEYGPGNEVLYYLDEAALLHDAGAFVQSDALFDRAELRMEELFTKSVTRGAATFLVNDNTTMYSGQVHERVLLHVYRALNYAYMGKTDDAVVEARKVSAYLAELNDRLGQSRLAFEDDPFAQYLSALLFEDQGRTDDARISYKLAQEAYARSARELGVGAPRFDPGGHSPDEGELVFLHYAGPGPRRDTMTLQVAWGNAMALVQASDVAERDMRVRNALVAGVAGNAITVALPRFVQDPYLIQGSDVEIAGVAGRTLVVEDVTRLARSTLQSALPAIQARAVVRATTKYMLARLAQRQAEAQLGQGWGSLVGLAAQFTSAATETADTRCWATLSAQIRMARVWLPPGVHTLKVRYLGAGGAQVGEDMLPGVEIRSGRRTYVHVRTSS